MGPMISQPGPILRWCCSAFAPYVEAGMLHMCISYAAVGHQSLCFKPTNWFCAEALARALLYLQHPQVAA